MREIKFRAWDKRDKKMVFDFLIQSDGGGCYKYGMFETLDDYSERYELMQFTGLHDKNGKEIYEGDIVYFYLEGLPEDDFGNAEIIFSDGCFCMKHKVGEFRADKEAVFNEYPFFIINFTDVEVIGNIYENPELVKP